MLSVQFRDVSERKREQQKPEKQQKGRGRRSRLNCSNRRSKSLTQNKQSVRITDEHILAVQNRIDRAKAKDASNTSERVVPESVETKNHVPAKGDRVDLSLTDEGFYIQKELLEIAQFETLVTLAFAILFRRYTLFGSFTHYLAWCASTEQDPSSRSTVKNFLQSGRRIPRDLDVFDHDGKLHTEPTPSYHITKEISASEEYELLVMTRVNHKKHIYTAHIPYIGKIDITVDSIESNGIHHNGLDFDVNSLTYSLADGFRTSYEQSPPTILDLLKRSVRVNKIIEKIMARKATFAGSFDASPAARMQRILYVGRFRKMLCSGFNIEGWSLLYPTHLISDLDIADSSCGICYEAFRKGDKAHLSPCCSATSKKLICDDCFWETMKASAETGRRYKCPFCRSNHVILGPE